jgi:hypothetical protein
MEIAELDMFTALESEKDLSFNPLLIFFISKLFNIESIDISPSGTLHFDQPVSRYRANGKAIPVKPLSLCPSDRIEAIGYQQVEDSGFSTLSLQNAVDFRIGERNSA